MGRCSEDGDAVQHGEVKGCACWAKHGQPCKLRGCAPPPLAAHAGSLPTHHLASGDMIWGWSQMKVGLVHCR